MKPFVQFFQNDLRGRHVTLFRYPFQHFPIQLIEISLILIFILLLWIRRKVPVQPVWLVHFKSYTDFWH